MSRSNHAARHLLLTGPPGCGKTTVLQQALDLLRAGGWSHFGFWTPELRREGARYGFEIRLASGEASLLASVDTLGPARVGRYGVRPEVMADLVVPEIQRGVAAAEAGARAVIVMDEIGKMELLSQPFREAVLQALDSPARVLATVMLRPHPFADALKARPDAFLLPVTRTNRDHLPRRVCELIAGPEAELSGDLSGT